MTAFDQSPSLAPKGTPRSAFNPLPAFARTVAGRPTGYGGGANEAAWKDAVRATFAGCALPADCRVGVEAEFLLTPVQQGRNEPDLDNLIKTTVDALEGVIGVRPGTGTRVEADDVRVDRITASKRPAREGEEPGAHIVVSELREPGV